MKIFICSLTQSSADDTRDMSWDRHANNTSLSTNTDLIGVEVTKNVCLKCIKLIDFFHWNEFELGYLFKM